MSPSIFYSRSRRCSGWLVLSFLSGASTVAAAAPQRFDLPAQPLADSIVALSRQTGISVVSDRPILTGLQAPAVQGELEVEDALRLLLADSAVTVKPLKDGGYALSAVADAAPAGVEQLLVTGHHEARNSSSLRIDGRILDAPRAVQVVTEDVIAAQLINDPQDAVSNVSGATRTGSYTGVGENYIIRGFVQEDVVKDGFRAGQISNGGINATSSTDIANIRDIEVLKGPSAILFGRGEPGGVVNYVTREAQFSNAYSLQQQFGSNDFYRTAVHSNTVALPDRLAMRFDGAYTTNGSFQDRADGERYFAAPALTFNLTPDTVFTARGEFAHDDRSNSTIVPVVDGHVLSIAPYSRYYGEPGLTDFNDDTFRGLVTLDHRWNEHQRTKLSLHGRTSKRDGAYFILFNFAGPLFDTTTGDVARSLAQVDFEDENSTVRLDHTIDYDIFTASLWAANNRFLISLEHENETDDRFRNLSGHAPLNALNPIYTGFAPKPLVPFPGFPVQFGEGTEVDADADSILVLNRIAFRDMVFLSFGARFEWFDATTTSDYAPGLPFTDAVNRQDPFSTSPTVGLVVKPLPYVSLYANYTEASSSFKNVALRTVDGAALAPEHAKQWETGVKSELLDGRLIASLAIFQIDKSDVSGTDAQNPLFSVNAGNERSRGFEIDLNGNLLPGWKLLGSYAFIDARITEDPTGATTGNRRYGVPEQSGSVFTTYEFDSGTLRGFGVGGGVYAASQTEFENGNVGELPGYAQLDALIWYQLNKARIQLNAKNLLDHEYYYATGNATMAQPAPSRTVIGSIEFKF